MKLSRRKFLTILGSIPIAGILTGLYMRFHEASWFEVTEKNIKTNKFDNPLRILHLSDFHASPVVSLESIEKAIDISIKQNTDLAFITGDFITSEISNPNEYKRILRKLSKHIPTFACVGNHDGGSWARASYGYNTFSKLSNLLRDSNIKLLFNQGHHTIIKGQPIHIVGLGDLWAGDFNPAKVLKKKRDQNEAIFVLCHNPDAKTQMKKYDWDVMYCGHTHGGQLVIPILGLRPFLPVIDKSFAEGILSWGDRHIHITRGVGNLHGMRFNCRPEISILNIL